MDLDLDFTKPCIMALYHFMKARENLIINTHFSEQEVPKAKDNLNKTTIEYKRTKNNFYKCVEKEYKE